MKASEGGLPASALAALIKIAPRTLRYWARTGVIPQPPFRGAATVYGPREIAYAKAVVALIRREGLRLSDARRHLATLTFAEVERIASPELAEPQLPAHPPPAPTYPSDRWEHITLFPGLELRVNTTASPVLRQIAQAIYDHYGPRRAPPA